MNHTFRSLALCAVMGTTAILAAPQAPPNDAKQVNREARVEERLALTAEQRSQFRTIMQNRRDQVTAIRNDASLSQAARNEKLKATRMDADGKIRAMLNENQIAEYNQILKERRDKAIQTKQTALPPQ